MPELPDVAIFHRYFRRTSLHRKIRKVDVENQTILGESDRRTFQVRLEHRTFEDTLRHGKYLFVKMDDKNWAVFHFGMTGFLQYYKNSDKMPEYSQIIFHFTDGTHLAYISRRKLGTVDWLEAPEKLMKEKKLGPDILNDISDFRAFSIHLRGKRGCLKSQLMNQQLFAGIGNVYADEILYHSGFHPETRLEALSEEQMKRLYQMIDRILKKTIDYNADPEKMPSAYLLPNREEGKSCPRCGGRIQKIQVSGRPTYYCPEHQYKII